ncbi:hypothetical protein [Spirillospora sp. NBC_01491]|uniref:hypothetical protein n=1 Tax=Spirillospora sp. NBC_01491 TaxID=2976007 RepID=UPI002E36D3B1|nr:hypothetical protein [Spirillospora sp. NBC_01491]
MAYRLWSALAITVSEADGWRSLAARSEADALMLLGRGQLQEAGMHLGRAEAYALAADNVMDVLRGLEPWDDLIGDGQPNRWGWAVRRLLWWTTR